ncbi:MarR family transcriptional regulator [uncultured Enterovirga sp.]|uniref:MarR family transcriptional regulator n=1 Tax=uncultured Enterovirga sp. TaxID=2026352 RepID=UPI0035CBD1B0
MIDDQALVSGVRNLAALASRIEDRLVREKGVSLAQSRGLEVILHTLRASWSDLATVLGLPRTITEALDALERDGLITRSPDPVIGERRPWHSRKRHHDRAAAQVARDQVRAVIFGVLTDGEKDSLLTTFQRMREAAQAIDTEELLNLPG